MKCCLYLIHLCKQGGNGKETLNDIHDATKLYADISMNTWHCKVISVHKQLFWKYYDNEISIKY